MNKTVNINLAGLVFHIDEDAFHLLQGYLAKVKASFASAEGREEIIADIEARMAELFQKELKNRQVLTRADVEKITAIMGAPEDYAMEGEEPTGAPRPDYTESFNGKKRVFRNPDDKILGGVAGGLGAYFDIDPVWIRLLFVISFFGWGTGFWIYIILWVVMPEARTTAEKLQMRGERVNISNIERSVKEEYNQVKDNMERRGLAGALGQFFEGLLNVLRVFFSFLGKFLIGLITMVGIFALIALSISLVWPTIHINSGDYYLYEVLPFADTFFHNATAYNVFLIGLSMFLIMPIIWVILLGVRSLFSLPRLHPVIRWVLGSGTFIGLVMVVSTSIYVASQYTEEAIFKREEYLTVNKEEPIVLRAQLSDNDSILWQSEFLDELDLVRIDVRKGYDTVPYLEIRQTGRGSDLMEARKNARGYRYGYELDGNILTMQSQLLKPGNPTDYLGEQVRATLYLPVGYKVYLDHNIGKLIYDIKNVDDIWDWDMLDHTWIMTERGLDCMDCNGLIRDSHRNWIEMEEEGETKETTTEIEVEGANIRIRETRSAISLIQWPVGVMSEHLLHI